MDLKKYLLFTLGQRYSLDEKDVVMIAWLMHELREAGHPIRLAGAPLADTFEGFSEHTAYEMIAGNRQLYEIQQEIRHGANVDTFQLVKGLIKANRSTDNMRRAAIVVVTEWQEPLQLVAAEEIVEPSAWVPAIDYNGWLKTGMYTLTTSFPDGENGEPMVVGYDLTKHDGTEVPVEVLIARVMHAVWNPELGAVDPSRVENVTRLLAQLFNHEREHHQTVVAQLTEQVKASTSPRLWPKEETHWLFDPKWASKTAAFPVPMDHPKRPELVEAIGDAAKFAVSRASGMGTSRVFNIEAFVTNVVGGLIGEGGGGEGNLFDFPQWWGCDNPLVALRESGAEIELPVGGRNARSTRPATEKKAAVKPASKK
jgi:hypothetical protein